MKSVLKMAATSLIFTSLGFGQSKLAIDKYDYHYLAVFDATRITEQRLRELLIFSPYNLDDVWKLDHQPVTMLWSQRTTVLKKGVAANTLELCIEGNPRYLPCGTRDITDSNFFVNAQMNVTMNEEVWNALNRVTVLDELQKILKQFRDSFRFSKTLQARRLKYLQSGDTATLSGPITDIHPSEECWDELNQLNLATTLQERYNLSLYGWQNCLNSAWNRTSPAYPISDWKGFLQAYAITEEFTPRQLTN